MDKLYKKGDIFYLRYVDDIIIMAKTRWKLKTAIKTVYEILDTLKLKVHTTEKRFIGKTSEGFDFLGYFFKSKRKLKPSKKALDKFVQHSKRLLEQGDDKKLLFCYVERFISYFHGGLKSITSKRGIKKYLRFIEYKLQIKIALLNIKI